MLSPSNTYQGLTEDEALYPTGVRNYARIAGADHLQAIAHAQLAKTLGARRVAVLSARGDDDFRRFATDVATAGPRLGVDVVRVQYDNDAADLTPVARAVAGERPDAVVVADILYPGVRGRRPRGAGGRGLGDPDPPARRVRPVRRPGRPDGPRREGPLRQPVRHRQLEAAAPRNSVPQDLRSVASRGRR